MPETQDLSTLSSNYCNVMSPDYYMGEYNLPHVYTSDDIKQRPEDYYAKLIFDPASIKRKIWHPERKSTQVYSHDSSHTAVVKSNSASVKNGVSEDLKTMHNSEKEIIDFNNKLDQLLSGIILSSPRYSIGNIKVETDINIDSLFEKYAKDSKFNDIGLTGRLSESENFISQNHTNLMVENAPNIAQKGFNGLRSQVLLDINNPNKVSDINEEKDISSIIHDKNEKKVTGFDDKVQDQNHLVNNMAFCNTKFNKLLDKYLPQDSFDKSILMKKDKEKHVNLKEAESAAYFPEINDGRNEEKSAHFCENSDGTHISSLGDLDDQVNDKVSQPHPFVSSDSERNNSRAHIESLYEKYKPTSENVNDDLDDVFVSGIHKVQAKKNRYELTPIPLNQKLSSFNDQQVLNRVTKSRSSNSSDKSVRVTIPKEEAFSRNFSRPLSSSSNFDELNFYLKGNAHEGEDQNKQNEHINKAFVKQKPKVKPKPAVKIDSVVKITKSAMDAKNMVVESTVLKSKQNNIDLETQDFQKFDSGERQEVIEANKGNRSSNIALNRQMIGTELKRRFSALKQMPDVFKKLPKCISRNETKYRDRNIQNVTVEKMYENIVRERIESSKELAWEKLTKSVSEIPEIFVENVEITNSEVENLLQGLNNSNDNVVIQSKPKHISLSVQSKFHTLNDSTRSKHLAISASSTSNKSKPNKERNNSSNTMQVITNSHTAKPLTICMRKCLHKHLHIAIVVCII